MISRYDTRILQLTNISIELVVDEEYTLDGNPVTYMGEVAGIHYFKPTVGLDILVHPADFARVTKV
jgi:hypothetical protein